MSDNNVPEALARGNEVVQEKVVEKVPEDENKSEMPSKKKTPPPPTITNPEPVESEATPKVNKKLSAMSKNTKEKQKNRKLSKPTTVSRTSSKGLDINPMYLFGLLGVIIAAASLWYQRKSFLKDERSDEQKDETPVQNTGGGENEEKKSPPKKKKQPFDPWEWKREHQQTGIFPGNYDFD